MKINPALRGSLTLVARGHVSDPDVSGDGEVVVYSDFVDGSTGIFRNQDGESVRLSPAGHSCTDPDVNHDGTAVVFSRFSTPNPDLTGDWDIALWEQGEGPPSIIAAGSSNQSSPSISDDGRVIAWDDDQNGELGHNSIFKMVEGEIQEVTSGTSFDMFPVLSGDGERLIWRRFEAGKSEIWLQDQNDVVKPFLSSEGALIRPSISNDGKTLVFADKVGRDENLVHHDESTGSQRMVADESGVRETWAHLSGDGQTIAWTGIDSRGEGPAETNIFIERDGVTHQVTTSDGGVHVNPKLSDDGKTLVWTWIDRKDIGNRAVYRFDFED